MRRTTLISSTVIWVSPELGHRCLERWSVGNKLLVESESWICLPTILWILVCRQSDCVDPAEWSNGRNRCRKRPCGRDKWALTQDAFCRCFDLWKCDLRCDLKVFRNHFFTNFSDGLNKVGLEDIEIVWEFYLNGANERNQKDFIYAV